MSSTGGGEAGLSGSAGTVGSAGKSYTMGDVGAGARVQQGEHLTMIGDTLAGLPEGDTLTQRFEALLAQLSERQDLDPDTKELAIEKTKAVADGLAQAQAAPGGLRKALLDAKQFLGGAAGWAWEELGGILKSEAAQKTIATISEATTRTAIAQLTGMP